MVKVTNATVRSETPKMLLESDEEPADVFQLLQVGSH